MKYLNESLRKSGLVLKNRLVMPPMATHKSEEDGSINPSILDYYNEKSKGGYIGLIIIEHSFVSLQGKAGKNQISADSDDLIAGLRKLSEVIHNNGCKTIMQINHAGSAADSSITGMYTVGPSAVLNPSRNNSSIPKELNKEEINKIVVEFKNAAIRVKKAGFDGVEIHSAHGYLLNQFLSPITNRRKDEYGGDINGRIKIHLEIISAIRKAVGKNFPIFLRIGASDYMKGGTTLEDSKAAAFEFEKAGLDVIDISGGMCRYTIPGVNKPAYFSDLSRNIKKVVSIPVIVTGGITSPELADKIISEEKADLVGVGRAIYRDSQWAMKAMQK